MIDYMRLGRSQAFYSGRGFKIVEAPWEIEVDVNAITKPVEKQHLQLYPGSGKALVASAEQSFLQLRKDGKLPNGIYQAITPCFRDEIVDDTHKRMFVKNELIRIEDDPMKDYEVELLVIQAQEFFLAEGIRAKIVDTNEAIYSRDLVCMETGIELGSYGMRRHPAIGYWIYATGLAEPRFSFVKQQLGL